MDISVHNEKERKQAAIDFAKKRIECLEYEINSCDYYEDPYGNLVHEEGCYSDEKRDLVNQKHQWEIMLDILTNKVPFSMLDW